MGAFNEVNGVMICPNCSQQGWFDVQFKYGDVWQHTYRLGDKLKWGGNDVGEKSFDLVKVEGISGPCGNCDCEFLEVDIIILNNTISKLIPWVRNIPGSRR